MTDRSIPSSLVAQFKRAIEELSKTTPCLRDENVDADLRTWLDGDDKPLDWTRPRDITADEYFFITTLYGNMNSDAQRTMIRKFFGPLFVRAAERDIRNFRPETKGYAGLRSNWHQITRLTWTW